MIYQFLEEIFERKANQESGISFLVGSLEGVPDIAQQLLVVRHRDSIVGHLNKEV